jgi:hypothetical protein
VFHNVEQAHRRKSLRQHAGIVKRRLDDLAYTAAAGISHALKPRFHEHNVVPGLLNRPRDAAISTAHIEKRAGRRKKSDRLENAAIPVLKPEGRVFDQIAEGVPLFGV